jgi:glutamate 5-kinase
VIRDIGARPRRSRYLIADGAGSGGMASKVGSARSSPQVLAVAPGQFITVLLDVIAGADIGTLHQAATSRRAQAWIAYGSRPAGWWSTTGSARLVEQARASHPAGSCRSTATSGQETVDLTGDGAEFARGLAAYDATPCRIRPFRRHRGDRGMIARQAIHRDDLVIL